MIECGPRPGLLVRSSARRPIGTPGCSSFMKCDQVFGKLTQSPEFDRHDRRQGRIEDPEPHRLLVGLDDMGATVAACRAGRGGIPALSGTRQLVEPRPDGGERAHEAARPQQLPPQTPPRGQKPVQPLLVHFVPMQQTIGRPFIKSGILDVLAEHAGAFLVAATEEIAAVVVVHRAPPVALVIVLVRQGNPLLGTRPRPSPGRATPQFLAERSPLPKLPL